MLASSKRSAQRLYFLTSFLRSLHFADSPTEWQEVNGSAYVRTLINFVPPEVKLSVCKHKLTHIVRATKDAQHWRWL